MLTESQIKAAIRKVSGADGSRVDLRDDGDRGAGRLVLSMRSTDSKVTAEWYAVWYRDERRRMAKIGSYPLMGLADARKKFREEFAAVISAGGDPAGPRKRVDGAERRTVKDLFQAYVDHLAANGARSKYSVERLLLLSPLAAVHSIGASRKPSSVTADDIVDHLATIYKRGAPVMAAKARRYLAAAFAYGLKSAHNYTRRESSIKWGLTANPVSAVQTDHSANRTRDRFLSPMELRLFWEWLQTKRSKSLVASAVCVQIASGQRVEEILRVSAMNYLKDERMLHWPTTKNGLPHTIPLAAQATEILDALASNKHGLYFTDRGAASEPAKNDAVRHLIVAYIEATGAAPFMARDIRRTWKTLAGRAGLSKEIRDRLQNHAKSGDISSRHYDRYDYLPEKRAAIATWSAYLGRILAGELDDERGAEVVKLETAQAAA